MTTPNEYLQSAIDRAKVVEAETFSAEKRIFPGHCAGRSKTPIGEIVVFFVAAKGQTTSRPEHLRQNWELNGKRISKEKLINALRGAA